MMNVKYFLLATRQHERPIHNDLKEPIKPFILTLYVTSAVRLTHVRKLFVLHIYRGHYFFKRRTCAFCLHKSPARLLGSLDPLDN